MGIQTACTCACRKQRMRMMRGTAAMVRMMRKTRRKRRRQPRQISERRAPVAYPHSEGAGGRSALGLLQTGGVRPPDVAICWQQI